MLPKILAQEINLAKFENKFEPAVIIQEEKEVASELSFEDIKEEEIEQPVEEHQDAHAEVHVEDEIKPLVELSTEELKHTPIEQPIVIEQEETIPDDDPEEDRCKPIELENKPIDKKRHAFEKWSSWNQQSSAGVRYICIVCNETSFCSECEQKDPHLHPMIMIRSEQHLAELIKHLTMRKLESAQ